MDKKRISYRVEEALKTPTSQGSLEELQKFLEELIKLDETACKGTHYEKLDEWLDPVYALVHQRLNKYGFINGGAARGLKQPMDAEFWWKIYAVVSNVCYSPNLHTEVANYHSSAWERSRALIADVVDIIEYKSNETLIK